MRTGADGRYTFTGLQAGLSYRVGSMDRSLLDGHGWSYDKHWEPNGSDFDAQTGLASFRAGEQNADTGLVLAQNDYRVSQIIVVPGGPERTEYQTGDVLDVYAGVYISGNASDQYGAKMTLPAGLRKLQRLGGIPAFMAEDEPDEVTGMWHERKMPGPIEFLGARVVVDEPISASEITVEVWDGVFGPSDPDLGNNTLSRAFSARQRVQPGTGGEPTTEPTTGPAPAPTTAPAPAGGSPAPTTTGPAVVPVARKT
ncbi:hypothetical protein K7G98_31895, partial [Saccharothrix sp. MB29]|nr:hypothetical protein [Saccharothrix sp. MB29]